MQFYLTTLCEHAETPGSSSGRVRLRDLRQWTGTSSAWSQDDGVSAEGSGKQAFGTATRSMKDNTSASRGDVSHRLIISIIAC